MIKGSELLSTHMIERKKVERGLPFTYDIFRRVGLTWANKWLTHRTNSSTLSSNFNEKRR